MWWALVTWCTHSQNLCFLPARGEMCFSSLALSPLAPMGQPSIYARAGSWLACGGISHVWEMVYSWLSVLWPSLTQPHICKLTEWKDRMLKLKLLAPVPSWAPAFKHHAVFVDLQKYCSLYETCLGWCDRVSLGFDSKNLVFFSTMLV